MKITHAFALIALIVAGGMALGQSGNGARSASFPPFTLTEGQMDADGFPTSGAKLCLVARPDCCYQMPAHSPNHSGKLSYEFGLEPHAERLHVPGGGSWVFFSAVFS